LEARSELDFDGKSHTHLLVGGCEICLHTQLTDSPPPQTLNLRKEPSIFRNTVFYSEY